MTAAKLEHVNITVTDSQEVAELMSRLFDWHVRWQGPGIDGGHTVHVGTDRDYLAMYSVPAPVESGISSYAQKGGLNHVGVVVDDLAAIEKRVLDAGFRTHSHADYEPGQRFYFTGPDGIEFEVVSYS